MNILDTIAEYSMLRVKTDKRAIPQERLREKAELMKGRDHRFLEALRKPGLSFICEIKKASPSKGIISESFPYLDIAKEYENAGADCVSCLTEPKWFKGSDSIFRQVRARIDTPMIRKDFTVDEYQIYQAKCMEADAVLLICSIYGKGQYKDRSKAETDCTKFVSDKEVYKTSTEKFKVGDIDKYTIVIWIEGNDPECIDDIRNGHVRMRMLFSVRDDQESTAKP